MTIDSNKCQYCFVDYEQCTCCEYCSCPHGTCACHLEGEHPCTKLHPSDSYKAFFNKHPICGVMGYFTIEDIDNHVMKSYVKECWPERLKN